MIPRDQFEDNKEHAAELQKSGRVEEALKIYRQLSASAPNDDERAAALIGESTCADLLGRTAEARECLRVASQIMEHTPDALIDLAYLEAILDAKEGNDDEALGKLNRILADFGTLLNKTDLRHEYERIQIQRAYSLLNLDRPSEAMPIFFEAVDFRGDKPDDFPLRAAYCLARCGKALEAQLAVENLLEQSKSIRDEARSRYYLALIFACQRRYTEALKELEFCERHLDDLDGSFIPGLFNLLAGACTALGLKDRALRYRRASGQ